MKTLVDGRVFTRGRIAHFVDSDKREWPFLLVTCYTNGDTHKADGWVFSSNMNFYGFVPYDIKRSVGSFHFPSMRDKKKTGPRPGKPLRDLTASKK